MEGKGRGSGDRAQMSLYAAGGQSQWACFLHMVHFDGKLTDSIHRLAAWQ